MALITICSAKIKDLAWITICSEKNELFFCNLGGFYCNTKVPGSRYWWLLCICVCVATVSYFLLVTKSAFWCIRGEWLCHLLRNGRDWEETWFWKELIGTFLLWFRYYLHWTFAQIIGVFTYVFNNTYNNATIEKSSSIFYFVWVLEAHGGTYQSSLKLTFFF